MLPKMIETMVFFMGCVVHLLDFDYWSSRFGKIVEWLGVYILYVAIVIVRLFMFLLSELCDNFMCGEDMGQDQGFTFHTLLLVSMQCTYL